MRRIDGLILLIPGYFWCIDPPEVLVQSYHPTQYTETYATDLPSDPIGSVGTRDRPEPVYFSGVAVEAMIERFSHSRRIGKHR